MNEVTEHSRALADKIRADHRHSSRKQRIRGGIIVVLGVLICLGVLLWLQIRPDPDAAKVPEHATEDYGFTLTPALLRDEADTEEGESDELIPVSLYEDFLCDSCKIFHEESGPYLQQLIEDETISLTYYPFTFLVNDSTDEYAQRAANAAVCVADNAGVAAYANMHALLFENQPVRGGDGLSDETLIEYAQEAGADNVSDCITERVFDEWVEEALSAGMKADVTTTPTVRVGGLNVVKMIDGKETMPGPDEISVAITEVGP